MAQNIAREKTIAGGMTIAEAGTTLGKSERTVRRLIEAGNIEAKKIKGRWVVTDLRQEELASPVGTATALVAQLKSEVDYLRKENEQLRAELEDSRRRSDMIILQMSQNRKLLEDLRQPFWRRWRRRSAQAGGVDVGEAF